MDDTGLGLNIYTHDECIFHALIKGLTYRFGIRPMYSTHHSFSVLLISRNTLVGELRPAALDYHKHVSHMA